MGKAGRYRRDQAGPHPAAQRIPALDCAEVLLLSGPHLDAELDRALGRRVQAHLAGCPDCRLRLARERALELRIASSLRRSEHDQERCWRRAVERALPAPLPGPGAHQQLFPRSFPSTARWFALAASLLVLAALASVGLGLRHRHPWLPLDLRGAAQAGALAYPERAGRPWTGVPAAAAPAGPPGGALLPIISPFDLPWTARHDRSPA